MAFHAYRNNSLRFFKCSRLLRKKGIQNKYKYEVIKNPQEKTSSITCYYQSMVDVDVQKRVENHETEKKNNIRFFFEQTKGGENSPQL